MTVANQVSPHDHVVNARQIDSRFSLIVLAVEKLVVFDRDVMRLIELDQIQSIVILQRIVGSDAPAGRTLVMDFAIANRDVAGPKIRGRTTLPYNHRADRLSLRD